MRTDKTELSPQADPDQHGGFLAFISYSHSDNATEGRKWADWLKSMVENFIVPAELVGREGAFGKIPDHMHEVFLDRDILTAGGELTGMLRLNLERSRFLLVICSSRSAKSKYVNLEIDYFIQHKSVDMVIPVVVEGKDNPSNPETWVPNALQQHCDEEGRELPLYIDFRVREKARFNNVFIYGEGWTEVRRYAEELKRSSHYAIPVQRKMVGDYSAVMITGRSLLLATLLGVQPKEIDHQAALDDIRKKKERIRRLSYFSGGAVLLAIVLAVATIASLHSYRIAEAESVRARRAFVMIGDAYDESSRLIGDIIEDLQPILDVSQKEAFQELVLQNTSAYFGQFDPDESDPETIHLRSINLNRMGFVARSLGIYDEAEIYFQRALQLRKKLLQVDPANPVYIRNLAVSKDNLGDIEIFRAEHYREDYDLYLQHVTAAAHQYREGLEYMKQLVSGPELTGQHCHDISTSYLKLGDALIMGGDRESALVEFKEGLVWAEEAVARDSLYPKWQAYLGLLCYQIGRIQASFDELQNARQQLLRARGIFTALREEDQLTPSYAEWAELVETLLQYFPESDE